MRGKTYAAAACLAALTMAMPPASAAPPVRRPITPTAPGTPPGAAPPTGAPGSNVELTGDEVGATGFNQCRKQPRGAKFRITLPEEAELKDLVNWMMSISCQKFIWDPKIRGGRVTILSPEPVSVQEAYGAFYSALETMGLTVVPSGEYYKIVESQNPANQALPVYGPDGRAPANDRYVTQLFRTEGANTSEIVDVLNKLKSQRGQVDTVGELIILTDTGTSVRRLMEVVRKVDSPELNAAKEKIFFFQLQYAEPEETAATIREIFGEGNEGGAATRARTRNTRAARNAAAQQQDTGDPSFSRVVVDERTSTLIIVAPVEDYQVIRRLIERLDVPLAGGGGRIHVVKLKNADPEEVSQVLTQLGSGAQRGGAQAGGATNRRAAQQAAAAAGASPEAAELFSGDIKVTADPATRSLVILASTTDFKALREVIDVLDARRRQVYIEVYLLELSINKLLEGGAAGHFGRDFDVADQGSGLGFVASSPGSRNSILLSPQLLTGLAAGVIGPQVPNSSALLGLERDIPAFGVVIQALQEDSDVNFVAEPHLYTADNQEALIEVGRQVPTPGALTFPGGGAGGGLVPVQSIQRQDVTLSVKITPHVNDDTEVTLDVEMENNDIESESETLGVTTTKRRLKLDAVLARDGQPVVLGGLIQEVERQTTTQVPGLGSIPLLGWLFKSKVRRRQKVNLMMILVPHIIETPDDVRRIHERRMKERLEFIERYTAFKRRDLDANVNYRKKSGLLAELNEEAARMEQENEFRRRADLELQQQSITGELGFSPQFQEDTAPEDQGAAPTEPPTRAPTRTRAVRRATTNQAPPIP